MPKIVIIGYGTMFAKLIAGCITAGYTPVGVLRHEKTKIPPFLLKIKDYIFPSKDKSLIAGYNLYEIDATSVNSEKFKKELIKLNTDIVFIASWSEKISKEIINVPKFAMINCHPSLLPKYRGPNPYAQVILYDEKKTGVTFHLVDENYDTGPILTQKEIPITENETGGSLKDKCVLVAEEEIANLLIQLDSEMILPVNQKEEFASYQPQIEEKDVLLNFEHTAESIDRRIRAFTPWIKCFIPHKNIYFTFNKHEILEETCEQPAKLVSFDKDSLSIITGNRKIMKFSELKIYKKSRLFKSIYMKFFIKINDIMK